MALVKTVHRRPKRSGTNSTFGEKTADRVHSVTSQILGSKAAIKSIIAVFVLLVVFIGGFFWFNNVYANPQRVFWEMVESNLSTQSITKETQTSGGGAITNEYTQLAFTPDPIVRDIRQVTTAGTSRSSGHITIESIGTAKDTYQHYILINQPDDTGKEKHNYSKVYPMWIHNGGQVQATNTSQLFGNAIFGLSLFGNMPQQSRQNTVNYLKKAYKVNFDTVKKQTSHGRKTFSYDVKLNLKDYAVAARYYAKSIGLADANKIDPNSYKETSDIALVMTIDVPSRQLRQAVYKTSSATEKYSGYGIAANIKVPKNTVSYEKLQKTIQAASK